MVRAYRRRDAFTKTPGVASRKSRKADCVVTAWIESPFGPLLAAATSEGVCLLEFTGRRRLDCQLSRLRKYFQCAIIPGENEHITKLRRELKEYFGAKRQKFSTKLVYPGTPFEEKVWNVLLKIPYGSTVSYEEIAKMTGSPKSSRAVGRANGFNRVSIVIPCHRVINKNGELGGYGGGLWRKKMLLALEQNHTPLATSIKD